MNTLRAREGRFARLFRDRYLASLHDYRFFYDDIPEIGNPAEADYVFYFVPGINGTPGQMRFLLPSLTRVFGARVYLKALHVPEFSAHQPIWAKYTVANVERKLARLRSDLTDLLDRHERVTVLASSNGFYDFAAAASHLPANTLRDRVHLLWGACAPERFESTPWERVFYPLNGFEYEGHRWFAYPNHNALKFFNPETSQSYAWQDGAQRRRFRKVDLECRFRLAGLEWDYLSITQLGDTVRHVTRQISRPVTCPTVALVAANDGYWQGTPHAEIERVIRTRLPEAELLFRLASHLWVVTPSYLTELFQRLKRQLSPLRASARPSVILENTAPSWGLAATV